MPELRSILDEGRAEAEAALLREQRRPRLRAPALRPHGRHRARPARRGRAASLPGRQPLLGRALAVVATGGYGRGTLAPGSDVDLLFLLPYKQTAWGESVVEAMLYVLWDLKLKVGHATRSVDECLREAQADMTIRTALLEARFLFGDQALYDELRGPLRPGGRARQRARVRRRQAQGARRPRRQGRRLALPRRAERQGRQGRACATSTRCSGSPNTSTGCASREELVEAGLFTPEELQLFERCEEFLWRVRCHMHFVDRPGRGAPDLRRCSASIAERIGYARRGGAVRRRALHEGAISCVAKDVGDLTAIVCAELEARQAKHRPMLDRMFGRFRRRRGGALEADDFVVDNNRINVARRGRVRARSGQPDPPVLARRPAQPARSIRTRRGSRRARSSSSARRCATIREANRLFLDILTSRNAPEVVLRLMNEAGRARPLHPGFRPHRRDDAVQHVSPLHGRRASASARSACSPRSRPGGSSTSIRSRTRSSRTIQQPAGALRGAVPARHRQGPAGGPFDRRRRASRASSGPGSASIRAETETVAWLVEHHLLMSNDRPEPRPLRPEDDRDLRRRGADHGAAEAAARAHHRRHQGGRPRRLERLEGPAPAHPLLRDRGRAGRRRIPSSPASDRVRRAQDELRAALPDWTRRRSSTPMPRATTRPTG